MTKHNLSWEDVSVLAQKLGVEIKKSGLKPDLLIGITVGGLIPLALIAKELDIQDVVTASARSYNGDTRGELKVTYIPSIDLSGKSVLLIDEIAETGSTLRRISEEIAARCAPKSLRTATLALNPELCELRPDFCVMEDVRWLVFPWEK